MVPKSYTSHLGFNPTPPNETYRNQAFGNNTPTLPRPKTPIPAGPVPVGSSNFPLKHIEEDMALKRAISHSLGLPA